MAIILVELFWSSSDKEQLFLGRGGGGVGKGHCGNYICVLVRGLLPIVM